MAVPELHNVNILDTDANWLAWGRLVETWVNDFHTRPHTKGALEADMTAAGISDFTIRGNNPGRSVQIATYDGVGPIVIPVPSATMVAADRAVLDQIAMMPVGQRLYPVPGFYARIYGGAPKVDFTQAQLYEMALLRLGEYVINECM